MKVLPIQNINTQKTKTDTNTLELNDSKLPSSFGNILKYVKGKFPSFILFLHICVSKYVFVCESEISITPDNSTQIVYIDDDVNVYVFWTYFSIISIICFIWEFLYHLTNKYKCNKKTPPSKKIIGNSVMSATISLIAFQSTVFYMDDNEVFNCFMDYNEPIANVIFFMAYGVIILLASVQYVLVTRGSVGLG
jgi:hypothetical protein